MHAKLSVLLTVVILVTWVPVNAHHSFAAVFDVDTSGAVSGTVTKVEWMNPHAWIYIDVDNGDGDSENWAFELGSPNGLMRRGWTRKTVQVGDAISVTGYRARDGSLRGNVKSVVLADGTELTGMSSRKK
jgi:hypothetical protein